MAALAATIVLAAAACGDDNETGASSDKSTTTTTRPPVDSGPSDEALASAALLAAPDVADLAGGDWAAAPAEYAFPNDAELAATVPTCADFVDVVFDGGARHGAGRSGVLGRGEELLFTYAVVFPTEAEAIAMSEAVADPAFDACWVDFNEAAAVALPFGITAASYERAEPPALTITADDVDVEYMQGEFEIDGAAVPDTCLCVFARSGRGLVEVHSAEAVMEPAVRSKVAQAAVDKLRETLAASPEQVDEALAAAAVPTAADIGHEWLDGPEVVLDLDGGELASAVPACADYVEGVFEGGEDFGEMRDSIFLRGTQLLYFSAVVFPTEDEAAAMVAATAEPGFDECWLRYNEAVSLALPFGITKADYEAATPPALEVDADSVNVESFVGPLTMGDDVIEDSCVCVFAQTGRGVVTMVSPIPTVDDAERAAVLKAAIDKLAATLGEA